MATWTAQLSTQANGHPLPVPSYARGRSVWRNDRVPEGGWSVLVVRQCMAIRKEKRGNAAVQSAHACLFGSYDDLLGWGKVFKGGVDAGS